MKANEAMKYANQLAYQLERPWNPHLEEVQREFTPGATYGPVKILMYLDVGEPASYVAILDMPGTLIKGRPSDTLRDALENLRSKLVDERDHATDNLRTVTTAIADTTGG